MVIQSVVFPRTFSKNEMADFLQKHQLMPLKGIDRHQDNWWRIRITEPNYAHYITRVLPNKVHLIVGLNQMPTKDDMKGGAGIKIYYGIRPLKKNERHPTLQEAFDARQIRHFGIKQAQKIVGELKPMKKAQLKDLKEITSRQFLKVPKFIQKDTLNKAATKIQSLVRMRKAKKELETLKKEKKEKVEELLKEVPIELLEEEEEEEEEIEQTIKDIPTHELKESIQIFENPKSSDKVLRGLRRFLKIYNIKNMDEVIDEYNKRKILEEEPVKVLKFSYNPEWKKEIDNLYKSTRKTNTQEFKEKQSLLFQIQKGFDLYPTPDTLTKSIIDDFMKKYNKDDVYNILEPSMGLGSLLFPFIDRQNDISINKIDGIEYSTQLYNVIKDKLNISNYYNDDFLKFKQQRLYNLILMNPPYRGTVELNDKYQSEKEVYWYHIIKALLLDYGNYDKTIYLISPKIHNKLDSDSTFEPSINPSLEKRLKQYFNINTDVSIFSEVGSTRFQMLKESKNEFDSFDNRGNPSKMGLTIYLYKINQCCSNKLIKMGSGDKQKIFYGMRPLKKNERYPNIKEAFDKKQIRWWGIEKVPEIVGELKQMSKAQLKDLEKITSRQFLKVPKFKSLKVPEVSEKKIEDLNDKEKTIIYNAIYLVPYDSRKRYEELIPKLLNKKDDYFNFPILNQNLFKDSEELDEIMNQIYNGIDIKTNVRKLLY
jgi:hypothetical protein